MYRMMRILEALLYFSACSPLSHCFRKTNINFEVCKVDILWVVLYNSSSLSFTILFLLWTVYLVLCLSVITARAAVQLIDSTTSSIGDHVTFLRFVHLNKKLSSDFGCSLGLICCWWGILFSYSLLNTYIRYARLGFEEGVPPPPVPLYTPLYTFALLLHFHFFYPQVISGCMPISFE